MARERSILAICLALVLVALSASVVRAINSFPAQPSTQDNRYKDGGGSDCGHPWDDGTGTPPVDDGGDSSQVMTAKVELLPPPIVPAVVSGSSKWVGNALIYLWQSVSHTKISQKTRYWRL